MNFSSAAPKQGRALLRPTFFRHPHALSVDPYHFAQSYDAFAAMAIALASTSEGQPHAKVPQMTGLRKNGKNWHEKKKPFRPGTGHTNYAKRAEKQKQEAEVKKMEKEMKEEREEDRQVGLSEVPTWLPVTDSDIFLAEKNPSHQGQARRQGGEGEVRAARRQDAPEARRQAAQAREEEQDAQVLDGVL